MCVLYIYVCIYVYVIYSVRNRPGKRQSEKANQRKRKKERIESVEDMYECTN